MIKDPMGAEIRPTLHVPFRDYDELLKENKRLREALEIYASPDNWRQKDTRTGAFDWFLRGNAGWDIADEALTRSAARDVRVTGGELTMSYYTYENVRRVAYQDGAVFVPVCEKCGRFVKSDDFIQVNGLDELIDQPNATCSKCGRTKMLFEGWFDLTLDMAGVS